MEREQWDRLLAEYATGGLPEEEKKKLLAAALTDQDLFDRLMEEDALREAIELPGARRRLIDSLLEEARIPANPVLVAPKRLSPWLAWAASIGVVLVSGAVTYMMFERPVLEELARARFAVAKDLKPFVPPPPVQKPVPVIVEEAPKIVTERRAPMAPPPPAINLPLPTAPPPEPIAAKDRKVADAVLSARAEGETVRADFRAKNQAASAASIPPPTVWRRTGDDIWIRVPAGEPIGRNETIAIRYVLKAAQAVALLDERGRSVARKSGRIGEELELIVPRPVLEGAAGNSLSLSVAEESAPAGVAGGFVSAGAPGAAQVKILLRLR